MIVKHDIHNHTLFSSCCFDPEATMKNFVEKAYELGHNVLGISNHLWDEKTPGASGWYKGQTIDYGFEGKYAIPADTHGIKVMFGCETEYSGMTDTLGMLAETGKRFDYVLVPHTHTHMKNFVVAENPDVKALRAELTAKLEAAMPEFSHDLAARMIGTIKYGEAKAMIKDGQIDDRKYIADFCFTSFESLMKNPEFRKLAASVVTLVAHPFHPCGETWDDWAVIVSSLDRDRLYADFSECANLGVGLDVNIGTYHYLDDLDNDPMVRVMRIAKEAGCKFAFGTDSHSVKGLENIRRGDAISDAIGITENDLVDIVRV